MPLKQIKKWQILPLVAGLVLVICTGMLVFRPVSYSLKIDGVAVAEEEFQTEVTKAQYQVTKYFFDQYQAEVDHDFWDRDFQGEKPKVRLLQETLDQLRRIYAARSLALETGMVSSIDYSAFINRFQASNQDRQKETASGEAVYGLASFSQEAFLEYELDSFEQAYLDQFGPSSLGVSDAEQLAYYQSHAAGIFARYDDYEVEYIRIYYAMEDLDDLVLEQLRADLGSLASQSANSRFDMAAFPSLVAYYGYEEIASDQVSTLAKFIGDVLYYADQLEAGQTSPVIDENGCLYLIRLINRTDNGPVPFEEVKEVIKKRLQEEAYQQLVIQKSDSMELDYEEDQLLAYLESIIN
ncbi:peptidyl-prolyl cis-trans isomerase [Streptococcus suis]|nr:peptidyl-prolyl cis-trans isomerase [Streptococcus suis]